MTDPQALKDKRDRMTGHDSTEELMKQYELLVKEADREDQVTLLTDFVFAYVAHQVKRLKDITRRLPTRPWIFNVASGVGLAVILTAVITFVSWMTRLEARTEKACEKATAAECSAQSVGLHAQTLDRRLSRIDGNLDMLLQSRGLRPLPPISDSEVIAAPPR